MYKTEKRYAKEGEQILFTNEASTIGINYGDVLTVTKEMYPLGYFATAEDGQEWFVDSVECEVIVGEGE